uniref:Uncharacterized protein n=1 Tax=Wuchereria bancrofti TaxID=6293 RepID=A0A1I8EUH0_WUCBA
MRNYWTILPEHTGWNRSIESASDLANNIVKMNLYNTSLPRWIEKPTLEEFDKRSLKEAIMTFLEKHPLICVNYEPCRDIMGGIWLNHILTALRNAVDGQQTQNFIGYVSFDKKLSREKEEKDERSVYQLVKDKAIANWEEACGEKITVCSIRKW